MFVFEAADLQKHADYRNNNAAGDAPIREQEIWIIQPIREQEIWINQLMIKN